MVSVTKLFSFFFFFFFRLAPRTCHRRNKRVSLSSVRSVVKRILWSVRLQNHFQLIVYAKPFNYSLKKKKETSLKNQFCIPIREIIYLAAKFLVKFIVRFVSFLYSYRVTNYTRLLQYFLHEITINHSQIVDQVYTKFACNYHRSSNQWFIKRSLEDHKLIFLIHRDVLIEVHRIGRWSFV